MVPNLVSVSVALLFLLFLCISCTSVTGTQVSVAALLGVWGVKHSKDVSLGTVVERKRVPISVMVACCLAFYKSQAQHIKCL